MSAWNVKKIPIPIFQSISSTLFLNDCLESQAIPSLVFCPSKSSIFNRFYQTNEKKTLVYIFMGGIKHKNFTVFLSTQHRNSLIIFFYMNTLDANIYPQKLYTLLNPLFLRDVAKILFHCTFLMDEFRQI